VIVGGTIITLGQALYSSVYVPTTVTPSVSGDVEIMAAGNGAPTARINRDTRVPLVARVKLSNPSNHAITVLGARYVVRALKLTPTIPKERLQATAANREREYSRIKQSTVVELGNLLTPGTSLEGGEEMTRGLIVLAPADFTTAILRVDLALARPRYKRERGLTWTVPANGVLNSVAQIEDTSWLHLLTRSPRYIHFLEATGGQLGCQPPVEVVAYVDNDQRTTRKRWCRQPTRIDEHYGVTTEQISAETRLTQ
jgi:hypothetical protein